MEQSEELLNELCRYWQAELGLQHWKIEVKVVRGAEIGEMCGQNDYSFTEETALIRIKSADDYHGYYPYDMEKVLVHELLHLVLDDARHESSMYYEQAINRLSQTLLKLKRK